MGGEGIGLSLTGVQYRLRGWCLIADLACPWLAPWAPPLETP